MFPRRLQQEISKWPDDGRTGYLSGMDRDDFMLKVVRNLSAAMERKDTNASDLARRADLNPTAVYDILSGKSRSPKLDTMNRIADALGVPFTALFNDPADEKLDQELIEAILSLPAEERRRFLVMVRALNAQPSRAE